MSSPNHKTQLTLRQLNENDFKAIFEVWAKELYRGAHIFLYSREEYFVRTFEALRAIFRAKDPCFLGFEERGELVGAILGCGSNDGRLYTASLLWVHPKKRNLGYGSQLAELLYKFAKERGYRRFAAETDTRSPAIKKIMKKLGFHQARTIWFLAENNNANS